MYVKLTAIRTYNYSIEKLNIAFKHTKVPADFVLHLIFCKYNIHVNDIIGTGSVLAKDWLLFIIV